jgi:hypothetical protein
MSHDVSHSIHEYHLAYKGLRETLQDLQRSMIRARNQAACMAALHVVAMGLLCLWSW